MNGATSPPSRLPIPACAGATRHGSGVSTPTASTTSCRPEATISTAWATAVEPDADAFSTWWMLSPVAPSRASMIRPGAMPSSAEPTTAASTSGQRMPASSSAARTAVTPSSA